MGTPDSRGKIPNRTLYRDQNRDRIAVLHEFSCRYEFDLNAIKLYLLSLALSGTNKTRML